MECKPAVTIDTIRLNNSAHQKPSTSKPGTRRAVSKTSAALITNVKRPSVMILIGSVRIIRIGFKNTFISPKTRAASKAVLSPTTVMPGRIYADTIIAKVVINQRTKMFIVIMC